MLPKPPICALCPPFFLTFPLQKTPTPPDPPCTHVRRPPDLADTQSHRPTDPQTPQTHRPRRPTDPQTHRQQTTRPARRVGGMRGALKSAAPLHAVAAPSRRVKAERLSSSRAPALYSDSESHYYWDAKIEEIATSRKRATLQHFSLLLGPNPPKRKAG